MCVPLEGEIIVVIDGQKMNEGIERSIALFNLNPGDLASLCHYIFFNKKCMKLSSNT